ncbi:MAG TPA: hypothetical protein DCM08_09915 [Microscillaceae bacterium]|jgi:hypothetical protein|nr:hypothetical protein [Microscillaceae bacterium]
MKNYWIITSYLICFFFTDALAQRRKIKPEDVPSRVNETFAMQTNGAEATAWELEDGGKQYEVSYLDPTTQVPHEMVISAEGEWIETSYEVAFDALPQAVKDAFYVQVGDVSKIAEVEWVLFAGSEAAVVEIELKDKKGSEYYFTAEGNQLMFEQK